MASGHVPDNSSAHLDKVSKTLKIFENDPIRPHYTPLSVIISPYFLSGHDTVDIYDYIWPIKPILSHISPM